MRSGYLWLVRWQLFPVLLGVVAIVGCGDDGPPPPPPPPPTGTLSVTAANLPGGGATATITSPAGAAQTVPLPYSQGGLATGTYTIRGQEVENPPTTYEPTQATVTATVQANQTASATVSYQPIAPRLSASASGMPGGRAPPWSYARDGQAGFGTRLGPSAVVSNLPAGTYLVRAGAMLDGTTVYLPSVAISSIQVANGVNQRVNVGWSQGAGVTDLVVGTPIGGLTLPIGQSRIFRVAVPNGATELRVVLSGGTGDANLYLRADSLPGFPDGVACAGETPGNGEVCVVPNPKAGPWYLHIAAFQTFQGLAVSATTAGAAVVTLQGGPGSGRLQVPAVAGQAALDCVVTNGTTSGACEGAYPTGTTLAVTATPTAPSTFTGWT
ncbi:MAG: pre-peptidase C-terminal domain-containing protein, partial [Gemmatimonadales bacterium]|nr:pre-peptidase C-terminal domain-containing protein [Gemmatimonadales bacterium]